MTISSKNFLLIFLFLSISLPSRALTIEFNEHQIIQEIPVQEQLELQCTSWRVAVEANNLNPWKSVPQKCGGYVEEYMTGKGYEFDLLRVSNEAGIYARSVNMSSDGKDAWIFDVDETLISNLPYYAQHGYGYQNVLPFLFYHFKNHGLALNCWFW